MALKAAKNAKLYVEGYDLSGRSNKITGSLPRELEDVTTFDDSGHKYFPTLTKDSFNFAGFYDAATGYITEIMNTLRGTVSAVVCLLLGGSQEDNAICGGGAWQEGYDIEMPVAGVITLNGVFQFDDVADLCILLQPKATKTSDDNGTGVDKIKNVHKVQDTANAVAAANASDQATLETLLNEIKADYNTHRASTTYHDAADSTNVVSSTDATDEAEAITLANEIKADYNAHRSQSGVHPHDDDYHEVTSDDASNLATCITLANEIKADYNKHLIDDTPDGAVAYLQVFACGADDALIITIEDDDNSSFTSPNTLITFTTAAGVTAERKTVAGTVQRYVRAVWNGTEPWSATFAVCFKRN